MSELEPERTLTDADVDAIAARLEKRLSEQLVRKAGMGVIQLAWRGLFLAIILLAAYGYAHSGVKP